MARLSITRGAEERHDHLHQICDEERLDGFQRPVNTRA